MRLWHKDLIPYLPKQQLVAQWRECCAIAKNIAEKASPNYLLVNKIMNYPIDYFYYYTSYVMDEMMKRGYRINSKSLSNFSKNQPLFNWYYSTMHRIGIKIYPDWHNERYLKQCLFNLQEKYDCGGIPENEWKRIEEKFGEYLKSNSELEKEVEDLREYKMEHQTLYVDPMSW